MGKIVTVAIHKGGTGKTTKSVALACFARRSGKAVLLVDMDTQGNATHTFLPEVPDGCLTASRLFTKNPPTTLCFVRHKGREITPDAMVEVAPADETNGFAVIPADPDLLSVERLPVETAKTYRDNLRALAQRFDLVVIDTPPTMGFAMLAPLIAADFALSPIVPDAYSINGVQSLYEQIKNVKEKYNPDLKFLGLLINKLNRRNSAQLAMVAEMQKQLDGHMIEQTVSERSAIANAAYTRMPVWFRARSGSARAAGKEMKAVMSSILNAVGV